LSLRHHLSRTRSGLLALGLLTACEIPTEDPQAQEAAAEAAAEESLVPPSSLSLIVTKSGRGVVTSSPSGIACGGRCTYSFARDRDIVLVAVPDSGYRFDRWVGSACVGIQECHVNMQQETHVSAVFTALPLFNSAPVVSAGDDLSVRLPATASLRGRATDDGLPEGAAITYEWTQVSVGPGTATFEDDSKRTTRVAFDVGGTYVLRLTADDGDESGFDDIEIEVLDPNLAPSVNAGADQLVTLPLTLTVTGVTSDDNLPTSDPLRLGWIKVSGPGSVTFNTPRAASSVVTFGLPGTYVLALSASDGLLSGSDSLSVTVSDEDPDVGTIDEIIPANRQIDWSLAGVPGGIPDRNQEINAVTTYNANKTCSATSPTVAKDASAAIQLALDQVASGKVVYLPSGTYCLYNSIRIKRDDVSLRGNGVNTTIVLMNGAQIIVGPQTPVNINTAVGGTAITASVERGSAEITLSDTAGFAEDQVLVVSEANDTTFPILHVDATARVRQQLVRITDITGRNLTVSPPLYWSLPSVRAPKAHALRSISLAGLESFNVDLRSSTADFAVVFDQVTHSWVQSVKFYNMRGGAILLRHGHNLEIRKIDVRTPAITTPVGPAIRLESTSASLIEDNILLDLAPLVQLAESSSGNVIAYNYMDANTDNGLLQPSIETGISPHNHFNLYEGNVAAKFQASGVLGTSSDETLYRNWFNGTGYTATDVADEYRSVIVLNRFARHYNIVGNVLGKTGTDTWIYDNDSGFFNLVDELIYALGAPNRDDAGGSGSVQPSAGTFWQDFGDNAGSDGFQERDLDVEASLNREGNWDAFTAGIPTAEAFGTHVAPASLFRSAKPAYFGARPWPPIDSAVPGFTHQAIPAGYRFSNGVDPP
jgi:hypothetical protein